MGPHRLAAAAVYLLLTEHRAHAIAYLPYLIVLACPVMHFFMHRGGGHGQHFIPSFAAGA